MATPHRRVPVLVNFRRIAVAVAAGVLLILSLYLTLPMSSKTVSGEGYQLVVLDESELFSAEDLYIKDALEGPWAVAKDGRPLSPYDELLKDPDR